MPLIVAPFTCRDELQLFEKSIQDDLQEAQKREDEEEVSGTSEAAHAGFSCLEN